MFVTFAMTAISATQASAEVRQWRSADGTPAFKAELANAFGDTAYFKKEEDGYIHVPLNLLAKSDVAYILQWARVRDAQPAQTIWACQGVVAKNISSQWPNRIKGSITDDKENVNEIITPKIFTFIMVKKETTNLVDIVDGIAAADKKINAGKSHMMETVVITAEKENDFRTLRFMLGKHAGEWLMPNEWAFKDKEVIWRPFWRVPDVSVLILDPEGTVLCDSTMKDPDGKLSDPVEFLNQFAAVADAIRSGKCSVQNPYLNQKAFDGILAKKLAEKATSPSPAPILFDFSGIDSSTFLSLQGKEFKVSVEVGADGFVHNLALKEGGDANDEAALKQASMLWVFVPALNEGVPYAKKVGIPLNFKTQ